MKKIISKNLVNKENIGLEENISRDINTKDIALKVMFSRGNITGNLKKGTLKKLRKKLMIN